MAFWLPLLKAAAMAAVKAGAATAGGAAVGAAIPKHGMTQPGQAGMLPTPDVNDGFSRLIGQKKPQPTQEITIESLRRQGGF